MNKEELNKHMSIQRCDNCDRNIDTDYDAEHFEEGGCGYNCPICKDERIIELDPRYPEQAPQYEPCECVIKEAEDGEIDDTIDPDINYV